MIPSPGEAPRGLPSVGAGSGREPRTPGNGYGHAAPRAINGASENQVVGFDVRQGSIREVEIPTLERNVKVGAELCCRGL